MPTRAEYEPVARGILSPHLTGPSSAWRGFYQLLLWFVHGVPHIYDGNMLRKGIWRERAKAVQESLAAEFQCRSEEVPDKVDLLIKSAIFDEPPQRNNPLGIGFVTALFLTLQHFSHTRYQFFSEEDIGEAVFKGIREAPRSRPDIVVVEDSAEIAVISAKWSLRNDRLKDLKDECNYFKTLTRRLKFYAVTNEFSASRLDKVLSDFHIDGTFHVNRRLVVDVAKVNGRLSRLRDLSDLIQLFQT